MSDTGLLLPSSSTPLERDLSASMNPLPRVGPAAELIRTAKREDIPDSVVPFLIYEYGLGELLPYLSDPRTAIATGVLWQRLRGTPQSFRIALGWIGNDGIIEESEGGTSRWSQFQLGLAQAPADLSQTDSVVEIGRLSSPVRSSLFRIYGGWYDGRRFNLDDHQLSGLDTLCDHTGVYLKDEWPQLSFGREFKDEQGDISGDLAGALGVHRHTGIRGLYEDRTYLSNSVLGETSWRTLHIQDLSSVISRLHFSVYGPWWNNASDWDIDLSWDQILDWAGLQNKFTPALKFAKAGIYLGDGEVLGDTNACLPARSSEEFGDGPVFLSEGNTDTGEGILSEHLSRIEFVEINERFEHQTELGSMWLGGGNNQVQVETHPLEHGVAYASAAHPSPPEHATLITSLSHYNNTRNNRSGLSYHVYGDGAGHKLGRGEDWTPLGLTDFADNDGSHGYPEYFDLDSLVIDEVAGTISAVDTHSDEGIWSPGTTHTRPLFNADGVRRTTQFRFEYEKDGYNVGQIWIGFEIQLLPSHRHHTRELTYDDVFQLSKSRLSEHTPIPQTYSNTREHTTSVHQTATQSDQWQSAQQTWDSATWDGPDGWFEVDAQPVDTWASTYSWTNYPQLEQVLGFSRTMLTLSENGHLSDSDGVLGDTHATLGFFEDERTERSHQTTADHSLSDHKLGVGDDWASVRGPGWNNTDPFIPRDIGYAVETIQIDEVAGTISAQRVEYRTNYIFSTYWHYALGTVDTFPLYDADGIRQRVKTGATTWVSFNYAADSLNIPNVWGGTFTRTLFIGAPFRLVPTHRERSATLKYLDRFILSLSRLSETIDLSQVTSNTREHTAESLQVQPQSNQWQLATETWDGLGAWDTEPGWFDTPAENSTWATRYAWQQYPQLEHVLGFSLTMVTLSENGHLSDSDGILGDTHATLGFFEDQRTERSHQTMAPLHPYGFGQGWEPLARRGNGDIAWVEVSSIQIIEPTAQIPQGEIRGTVQHRAVDDWWRDLFDFVVPLYSANGDRRELRYANQHYEISYPTGIGSYEVAHVFFENPSLTSLKRERFQTLAYDDLFELSRTRLSEHIPLFNEQAITREHGSAALFGTQTPLGWNDSSPSWATASDWQTGGYFDAATEPSWYEAYSWQQFPQFERLSSHYTTHLYLSDTDDGLGGTNATLGWNVSQRFDRSHNVVEISGIHQILSAHRQHTRSVFVAISRFTEPSWADGGWAGPGATDWVDSSSDWAAGSWGSVEWFDQSTISWANQTMWGKIARWQIASLVVESVHQTHN